MKTSWQREFIAKTRDWDAVLQLFDLLPDVAFFVKDAKGRFVLQNSCCLAFAHMNSEREVVGKRDVDFFSKDRADYYRQCDLEILRTGKPQVNRIEVAPDSEQLVVCSKVPIYSKRNTIIGLAGVYRKIEGYRDIPEWYGRFARVVDYIRKHYASDVALRDLASIAGVSVSQLNRRFAKVMNTSANNYLLSVRLAAARDLLEKTNETVATIATSVGFYDQSHFSRTFKQWMACTPQQYRKKHQEHGL